MTHRLAVVFSLAITLLLAGGVYAGRDRLMPGNVAEPAAVTQPTTGETTSTNLAIDTTKQQTTGAAPQLQQGAQPPMSPAERAAENRSLLPSITGARGETGASNEHQVSGSSSHEREHDEEHEEEDDDD